jgi:hypothetical protein
MTMKKFQIKAHVRTCNVTHHFSEIFEAETEGKAKIMFNAKHNLAWIDRIIEL